MFETADASDYWRLCCHCGKKYFLTPGQWKYRMDRRVLCNRCRVTLGTRYAAYARATRDVEIAAEIEREKECGDRPGNRPWNRRFR